MVLDRQYVVEAGKESPNHVVGEEGHVNNDDGDDDDDDATNKYDAYLVASMLRDE